MSDEKVDHDYQELMARVLEVLPADAGRPIAELLMQATSGELGANPREGVFLTTVLIALASSKMFRGVVSKDLEIGVDRSTDSPGLMAELKDGSGKFLILIREVGE
jgi:hypothetical protein